MVSISWITSCLRKFTLWKVGRYMGYWLHYGRTHGWTTSLSWWFWSRLIICYLKSTRYSSWFFTRRIFKKWKVLRLKISWYPSPRNFRITLRGSYEWRRNRFNKKNVRYESIYTYNCSLSYRTWLVWQTEGQRSWIFWCNQWLNSKRFWKNKK